MSEKHECVNNVCSQKENVTTKVVFCERFQGNLFPDYFWEVFVKVKKMLSVVEFGEWLV